MYKYLLPREGLSGGTTVSTLYHCEIIYCSGDEKKPQTPMFYDLGNKKQRIVEYRFALKCFLKMVYLYSQVIWLNLNLSQYTSLNGHECLY